LLPSSRTKKKLPLRNDLKRLSGTRLLTGVLARCMNFVDCCQAFINREHRFTPSSRSGFLLALFAIDSFATAVGRRHCFLDMSIQVRSGDQLCVVCRLSVFCSGKTPLGVNSSFESKRPLLVHFAWGRANQSRPLLRRNLSLSRGILQRYLADGSPNEARFEPRLKAAGLNSPAQIGPVTVIRTVDQILANASPHLCQATTGPSFFCGPDPQYPSPPSGWIFEGGPA